MASHLFPIDVDVDIETLRDPSVKTPTVPVAFQKGRPGSVRLAVGFRPHSSPAPSDQEAF